MILRLLITAITLLLAACDIPGLGPDPRIAQREAEAKAVGSACRHGLRNIEDCYSLNQGVSKAAIFAGWKAMDEYMRENKIEGILATVGQAEDEEEIVENKKPTADAKAASAREKSSDAKPKATGNLSAKPGDRPSDKTAAR